MRGCGEHLVAQARALRSDDEQQGVVERADRGGLIDRHRLVAWGQRHAREPGAVRRLEPVQRGVDPGVGESERPAERDADAAAVQRVGAGGVEQDAVDPERHGSSDERTDVLVVVDADREHEPACRREQLRRVDGGGAARAGEEPAVHVEPRDALQHRAIRQEDRGRHTLQQLAVAFGPRRAAEDRAHLESGVDELLECERALDDHDPVRCVRVSWSAERRRRSGGGSRRAAGRRGPPRHVADPVGARGPAWPMARRSPQLGRRRPPRPGSVHAGVAQLPGRLSEQAAELRDRHRA